MPYQPKRRNTIPVRIGNAVIGGEAPILIQSMTTTSPRDVASTVAQTLELAKAGCELVRITVPTIKDAESMSEVMRQVRAAHCEVPVSADIHFQPKAAFAVLPWVEKVRINPGNFCDTGVMTLKEISEAEFQAGRQRVFDHFGPFVQEAKSRGVALRIGVNHGSLSARMMYRFGDTVEGMVESALEFLEVCEAESFDQIVFSLKASHPRVAIEAYRLLAQRLEDGGHQPYPFHIGVTEAGEGEDGRIKSAVGIGSLLLDGIGDTIRVSLTESPVAEVPVARQLVQACASESTLNEGSIPPDFCQPSGTDPFHYARRPSVALKLGQKETGASHPIRVGVASSNDIQSAPANPERPLEVWPGHDFEVLSFAQAIQTKPIQNTLPTEIQVDSYEELCRVPELCAQYPDPLLWSWTGPGFSGVRALSAQLRSLNRNDLLVLRSQSSDKLQIAASLGNLLCDGLGDVLLLKDTGFAYDLLQACGLRRTKTEFISCPGCGRTLFNLQDVLGGIKKRLGHLHGVSIAVMGCIVNGPGEMADADFGYVGGAPGHISLYAGKTLVRKNIPQSEALEALVDLIRSKGRWIDPPPSIN
ncbi:MAG TPA: (E)-4-hydroxy-3-methylbut-2-enyl-diphosphate synthase [Fibrobacteraceae bacterium]|nr:(E)-4-hydroxy-3-methylbut-2-enyl-diphosphate synthase [Fibrobacteraceae bacterium]